MTENSEAPEEKPYRSRKPVWWSLVIVAFVALCAWAYFGTRHSDKLVQQASTTQTGQLPAYDPTTGGVTPSGAVPGALGTGGPPPAGGPGNSAGGSAGGTVSGVNPQAHEVPGPYAQGTLTPPAQLKR